MTKWNCIYFMLTGWIVSILNWQHTWCLFECVHVSLCMYCWSSRFSHIMSARLIWKDLVNFWSCISQCRVQSTEPMRSDIFLWELWRAVEWCGRSLRLERKQVLFNAPSLALLRASIFLWERVPKSTFYFSYTGVSSAQTPLELHLKDPRGMTMLQSQQIK